MAQEHMDSDDITGYRWESGYEKTWEALGDEASGSLQSKIETLIESAKKAQLRKRLENVRLGMMRHLVLCIDCSQSLSEPDIKPNRFTAVVKNSITFVDMFFEQNPLSQLSIVTAFRKQAKRLTALSGNPKLHKTALSALIDNGDAKVKCSGEFSLQNTLNVAFNLLKNLPAYSHRECLIISSALCSIDASALDSTLAQFQKCQIHISGIHLCAEIGVWRRMTKLTHGSLHVAIDEFHLRKLFSDMCTPPVVIKNSDTSLVRMGFPAFSENPSVVSICLCHSSDPRQSLATNGLLYVCPQCGSKYCQLPVECRVCGLSLLSAGHLARSYFHLYHGNGRNENGKSSRSQESRDLCSHCLEKLSDSRSEICVSCQMFLHRSLTL